YLPYVAVTAIILVTGLLAYSLKRKEVIIIKKEKVVDVLKEAKKLLDQEDYAEAVKYSAEALRDRLRSSLNLSKSLTDMELVHKVTELRSDVDSKKLSYVLNLGEMCTYGRYMPKKEEAETALKYAQELLKKF
ncbi:MAG: hypothetical protein ACP5GH_06990, partial [Nitrososphaeria archaeon]